MAHVQIFRDSFEKMLLVTIKGNIDRGQRMNAVISERILHEADNWKYAASYDERDKTYIVFTKQEDSKQLPVYC